MAASNDYMWRMEPLVLLIPPHLTFTMCPYVKSTQAQSTKK